MLAEFSFLRHPILKVMRFGKTMVPGIERIDVLFYDAISEQLIGRTVTKEMDAPFGTIVEVNKEPIKSEFTANISATPLLQMNSMLDGKLPEKTVFGAPDFFCTHQE